MSNRSPRLQMTGIRKSFPGVVALGGVDFDVHPGEVHALMGENGAGKSTLLKVLTGVNRADGGSIVFEGRAISPGSPQEAAGLGISAVYQELNLAPNLSVAENIMIGREPRGWAGIRWREVGKRAELALSRLGLEVDVSRPLGSCPVALQQMVAIARAIDVDARLLVLDEPTSSLDRSETERLFDLVRHLKAEGLSFVFVTHFLDEVYALADRITVLRNGLKVAEGTPSELPQLTLVEKMIGRKAPEDSPAATREPSTSDPILQAENLGRRHAVGDLSMSIAPGEVLGFAGLLGSGRTEALRLFFGVDRPDTGSLRVGRRTRLSPRKAIREGVGFLPEERKADGIFPSLSVAENILIVRQARRGWFRKLRRDGRAEQTIQDLGVATPSSSTPMASLSGGNQQKALLGRWLLAEPKLLLLDEPTRGIDVGAKFEIADRIESLRKGGMSFALVSSELPEVVRSSTKVAVLRDRRMVDLLEGGEVDEGAIMARIAQGGK